MTPNPQPPGNTRSPRIWAIIPAAGFGRRAGGPKQTFTLGDTTLTAKAVSTLLSANVTTVIVVTRTPLIKALHLPNDPRVQIATNDIEGSQMIDSIRIGLSHIRQRQNAIKPHMRESDGVLVLPADIPGVTLQTLDRCITAFNATPDRIIIAAHNEKPGHPILFPLSMHPVIDQLEGGLNQLPKQLPHLLKTVEVGNPDILSDLDTPDDFNKWKKNHQ